MVHEVVVDAGVYKEAAEDQAKLDEFMASYDKKTEAEEEVKGSPPVKKKKLVKKNKPTSSGVSATNVVTRLSMTTPVKKPILSG